MSLNTNQIDAFAMVRRDIITGNMSSNAKLTAYEKFTTDMLDAMRRDSGAEIAYEYIGELRTILHEVGIRVAQAARLAQPGVLAIGTRVEKIGSEWLFRGEVRSAFFIRAGLLRYIVEATGDNQAGTLASFAPDQLKEIE